MSNSNVSTEGEMLELIVDLVSHLDYTGWGRDSWEREVSEELRKRVDEFKLKHPKEFP